MTKHEVRGRDGRRKRSGEKGSNTTHTTHKRAHGTLSKGTSKEPKGGERRGNDENLCANECCRGEGREATQAGKADTQFTTQATSGAQNPPHTRTHTRSCAPFPSPPSFTHVHRESGGGGGGVHKLPNVRRHTRCRREEGGA